MIKNQDIILCVCVCVTEAKLDGIKSSVMLKILSKDCRLEVITVQPRDVEVERQMH